MFSRRPVRRDLVLLLVGASLGAVGWGAVLPFLYADIADARGLGPTVAAGTFTAFALGALVASPFAGRLADRARPVIVATSARVAMVGAIVGLMYAGGAPLLWLSALGYGAALAMVQPSVSMLVLGLTPARHRRDAFAWQFIGQNLGLALGGMVGGYLVDLHSATGSRPAYALAAISCLASAGLVAVVGRRVVGGAAADPQDAEPIGYRQVLRSPAVRWLLLVTLLLTLALYAQFDSGLPSFELTILDVDPTVLGTAIAINAALVAVLTAPVVRATRAVRPAVLLASCAGLWIVVWLFVASPMLHHAMATGAILVGYGLFGIGETMLAPVLSPLAAALAPSGATGRTLAAVNAAQTAATALGPAMSGVLLGVGLPWGFVALQVLCCVLAIAGAQRLDMVSRRGPAGRKEFALAA